MHSVRHAAHLPNGHGISNLWSSGTTVLVINSGLLTMFCAVLKVNFSLLWRHNGHNSVSNLQSHDCLLNHLFMRRSKKHQSSASLAFVRGIHRWPVNSSHKGPVTRKMFRFDDVLMLLKFRLSCKLTNSMGYHNTRVSPTSFCDSRFSGNSQTHCDVWGTTWLVFMSSRDVSTCTSFKASLSM